MKFSLVVLFVLLSLGLSPVNGQTTLVNVTYDDSRNITTVTSEPMRVTNTATEFLEVQLFASYSKKGLPDKPPCDITFKISSYNKRLLYEKDHNVTIIADEEIFNVGTMSYSPTNIRLKDNTLIFFTIIKRQDGTEVTVFRGQRLIPPNAVILTGDGSDKLLNESFSSKEISFSLFVKFAKADKLEFQIGKTKFSFDEKQMRALREFASNLTPKNGVASANVEKIVEELILDAPSKANNTSLEQTLKWLKNVLSRKGNWLNGGYLMQSETIGFSSCKIGYKEFPLVVSPTISKLQYVPITNEIHLNLADIDPQKVSFSIIGCDKGAKIFFATTNLQEKIKIVRKDNSGKLRGSYPDLKGAIGTFYR